MKYLLLVSSVLMLGCAQDETLVFPKGKDYSGDINTVVVALNANESNDRLLEARVTALERAFDAEHRARVAGDLALSARIDALQLLLNNRLSQLNTELRNYISVQINTTVNVTVMNKLINDVKVLTDRLNDLNCNRLTPKDIDLLKKQIEDLLKQCQCNSNKGCK